MSTPAYYSFIGATTDKTTARAGSNSASSIERRRQSAMSPASINTSSSNSSSSLNQYSSLTPVSVISSTSTTSSSSSSSSSSTTSESCTSQRHLEQQQHLIHRHLQRQHSATPTRTAPPATASDVAAADLHQFHSFTLHSLEPKSLKIYETKNEYLEAMKEDLAEWFNSLYPELHLTTDNFFQQLETGAIICKHANHVTQMGRAYVLEHQRQHQQASPNSQQLNAESLSSQSAISDSDSLLNSQKDDDDDDDDDERDSSLALSSATNRHRDTSLVARAGENNTEPNNNNNTSLLSCVSSPPIGDTSIKSQNGAGSQYNSLTLMSRSRSSPRLMDLPGRSIDWFQIMTIPFRRNALAGTFVARDNICQFIDWCRSLGVRNCLLFETEDLVARKNETNFILCLLEVARIGFKVGMPTPLIIQLEQEIEREIENDAKLQQQQQQHQQRVGGGGDEVEEELEKLDQAGDTIGDNYGADGRESATHGDHHVSKQQESAASGEIVLDEAKIGEDRKKESLEDNEAEAGEKGKEQERVVEEEEQDFGPKPQVITNDLLSLHERVVQLLSLCTCPIQFPMVRVGDNGKYKVGDKLIIFVRILRRHIMVRVGGGWQELSEFLRIKDPCRSKSYSSHHHNHTHNQSQHQQPLTKLAYNSRSRFVESSHHLNKGHHNYRNNANGQRLISGSASMSWLSHNS